MVLVVSSKIEGNDTSCAWFDLSLTHEAVKRNDRELYLLPELPSLPQACFV